MADFRANLNAESQGRLQVVRLYEMTENHGVRDMLSFLIARDTMHQNQWLTAIEELEEKEGKVGPSTFNRQFEKSDVAYKFMSCSKGTDSQQGRWVAGTSMDGLSQFEYVAHPVATGQSPILDTAPGYIHGTPS